MTKTANEEDRSLLAVTKPGRENVYSALSSLEAENIANHLLDAESRSQITAKMRKEAETVFSSISDESARELTGLTPEDCWTHLPAKHQPLTPFLLGVQFCNSVLSLLPRYHPAYPGVSLLTPLAPCPSVARMGRPGAARCGPPVNVYGVRVGESIHPPV